MLHRFRKEKGAKGQNMVEYALILAIVVGIGWGIYDQVGLSGSIKGVFSDAGSLLEDASKAEKAAFDIKPSIDKLKSLYNKYNRGDGNMNAGDQNTKRGILMDFWLDDTDKKDADIAKLTSELGAKQWTYYHGEGPKYPNSISSDSVGLYWSTENLSKASLTESPDNYSKESVLSYYYNGSNYYVMKNRVWMDQKQYNNNGQPGLASKGNEYGKPPAEIVGNASGYRTYAEAQQAFKDAVSDNGGSFIFQNQ
mgnify:FL=1